MELLSEPEVYEKLGVSRRTFRRMISRGEAPVRVKITARRFGYLPEDIEAFLKSRRQVRSNKAAA